MGENKTATGNKRAGVMNTADAKIAALKNGGKVDLAGGTVESMGRDGTPAFVNRRQSEHHVPLVDLGAFITAFLAKYSTRPRDVDINIIHEARWPSDDVRIRITEYFDADTVKGDYTKVFA